ncbi:MAG: hypothetical protein ACR2FG_01645 [Marmoricola sp.]
MRREQTGTRLPRAMAGALGLAVPCLVGLVFVWLAQMGWGTVFFVAALAAALGALCGLALRDSRERDVSVAGSLLEAGRTVLIVLWY